MAADKELKKMMQEKASLDPDTFFATDVLRKEGYKRQKCVACERFFWATQERQTCEDASCAGGFRFIGNTPAKNSYNYIETWQQLSAFFKKRGYTPIPRYPVVARWRDDTDWVQASIYDFQPYVVSGAVKPPANPLVVPQFCLRFNDIDNVGITGSHYTAFVMVGQHAFVSQSEWNQDKYFEDLFHWFTIGLGIPKSELVLHEDGWAGGGNLGPCMEFFSRGLELCNQVYMMYEDTPDGIKDLPLRVLDMGLGLERNAWFSIGSGTSYDAVFPTVMNKLRTRTGLYIDEELQKKFLPYAAYLNIDEVQDIDAAWEKVAAMVGVKTEELRSFIEPLAALYSVAEHVRSLLIAISDGALPSNVGSMYNLRVLLRRAQSFIDTYKWNVTLNEIATWHAEYLEPIFPELSSNLENVHKIIDVEVKRYEETKNKSLGTIEKFLKGDITTEKLIDLYDTKGISPATIATEAFKIGKTVKAPDNFYGLVAEKHKQPEQKTQTKREVKLPLDDVQPTTILYFEDYQKTTCTGKVLKIIEKNVVLDQTCFYPISGGQVHDVGTIHDQIVVDVFKQGNVIVHVLETEPTFSVGEEVTCKVDQKRRRQLAQHHTATHIIGAATRKVLGSHINQASAKKDTEKAYIDVTHYELISKDTLKKIEQEANAIIAAKIPIRMQIFGRTEAEQTFGTRIYQGGAVPGQEIRIVEIENTDAQACGGTHLHNTEEAEHISIVKAAKVKDGVVRIYFVAGSAQKKMQASKNALVREWATLLNVEQNQIVKRAEELFKKWKKARKAFNKKKALEPEAYQLSSTETVEDNIVALTATALGTQPEHVAKTIKRFVTELEKFQSSANTSS